MWNHENDIIMIKDYWACITKLEIKGNWWNDLVLAWFRDWSICDISLNMYESPLFPYLIMVKNDLEVDNMWHVGQIYIGHLWSPWPLVDQNVHWNWTSMWHTGIFVCITSALHVCLASIKWLIIVIMECMKSRGSTRHDKKPIPI